MSEALLRGYVLVGFAEDELVGVRQKYCQEQLV